MVHIIAKRRTGGEPSKWCGLMILVRIVSATLSPTVTLPANSQKEAMIMACLRVRDLEETDVANELATSLAPRFSISDPTIISATYMRSGCQPIFHASRKVNIAAIAKM